MALLFGVHAKIQILF